VGAADPRVRQLIGVGVPVASLAVDALADCRIPKLIVQGERDQYGPPDALRAWFAALPAPKHLTLIPQADHFFTAQQAELRTAVLDYFREIA
jgi:alpha/beta superfamily hydrolase